MGGISNAINAPKRKRRFIQEQKKQAAYDMARNHAASLGAPTYSADMDEQVRRINNAADQQFQVDPLTFLPFVQSSAQLGGAIYNGVKQDEAEALAKADREEEKKLYRKLAQGG